jgi:hypothetical protein
LASAIKHQRLPEKAQTIRQKQYAAGLSWSPERDYSVSLKVNKVDMPHTSQVDYFTSGTLTWNPEQYMQFSLGYGDQLIKGARGVMISTRFELDKS